MHIFLANRIIIDDMRIRKLGLLATALASRLAGATLQIVPGGTWTTVRNPIQFAVYTFLSLPTNSLALRMWHAGHGGYFSGHCDDAATMHTAVMAYQMSPTIAHPRAMTLCAGQAHD